MPDISMQWSVDEDGRKILTMLPEKPPEEKVRGLFSGLGSLKKTLQHRLRVAKLLDSALKQLL